MDYRDMILWSQFGQLRQSGSAKKLTRIWKLGGKRVEKESSNMAGGWCLSRKDNEYKFLYDKNGQGILPIGMPGI